MDFLDLGLHLDSSLCLGNRTKVDMWLYLEKVWILLIVDAIQGTPRIEGIQSEGGNPMVQA